MYELEKFLALLENTFQASQTCFLDKLHNFVTISVEGLLELADRFDECAIPLLHAKLIIEWDLTLYCASTSLSIYGRTP